MCSSDLTCNGEVRFRILAEAAALLGAHGLATGHYARVDRSSGTAVLATAADDTKDQSYMLARLGGDVLGRLILPLGDMTKDEVRALADARALPAADAVESQDVCFVGQGGYGPFLERHSGLAARPGAIVDEAGDVLGTHDGFWHFTVGQRRGIGVASAEPLYVLATRPEANEVVVGPRSSLARGRIDIGDMVVYRSAQIGRAHV